MADEKKGVFKHKGEIYGIESVSVGILKPDGSVSSLSPLPHIQSMEIKLDPKTDSTHQKSFSFEVEPISFTTELVVTPENYDFIDSLFLTPPEAEERYRVAPSGRVVVSTDHIRDRQPKREPEFPAHRWAFVPLVDRFLWTMSLRTGEQLEDVVHRLNVEMWKLELTRRRLALTMPLIFPPPYP